MSGTFKDHFSGVAARYADARPRYPELLFDYLATLVPREATVWDCAAGNGQATLSLAERFARVIGTDASREQIAAAPAHPRVEYRVVPAEASGLEAGSVGLITVAQAVHWFDFERFYAEVRRVLRPGGVLAVWAYGVCRFDDPEVDRRMREFYGETVGPYWPPERDWVEAGYRTIPFPFREVEAPAFRMETRWTLDQLLAYLGTWSATSRCRAATGVDPVKALEAGLGPVWGAVGRAHRIEWPLAVRVGSVEA